MKIEMWSIDRPLPYVRNARKIPQQAIDKVAGSLNNTYYYKANIGNAINLAINDVIYTNPSLTTTLGADTYYQMGSTATTTHCTSTGDQMSMTVDSSGVITNIFCALP